jgi:hypothetical protein
MEFGAAVSLVAPETVHDRLLQWAAVSWRRGGGAVLPGSPVMSVKCAQMFGWPVRSGMSVPSFSITRLSCPLTRPSNWRSWWSELPPGQWVGLCTAGQRPSPDCWTLRLWTQRTGFESRLSTRSHIWVLFRRGSAKSAIWDCETLEVDENHALRNTCVVGWGTLLQAGR